MSSRGRVSACRRWKRTTSACAKSAARSGTASRRCWGIWSRWTPSKAGLPALRPQHGARELQEVVDTRHEREEHDRPERVLADLEEPAELIAEDQQGDGHDLGDHLALAERGGAD